MPKVLFIPAKIKSEVNENEIENISEKLPKNVAIAYSIQYIDFAREIRKILIRKHKITDFIQVLGCSKTKFSKKTKAVLLVGSGKFHAISLAYESKGKFPVYILEQNNFCKISEKETEEFEKIKKSAYLKYLNSDKIGILVSIKPGQFKLNRALSLNNKIKNKELYFFLADNIDKNDFENFSDINSWVNTACPRLDFDAGNRIVNLSEIK